jgi:hypothetical protein
LIPPLPRCRRSPDFVGRAEAKAGERTQPWATLLTAIEAHLEPVARLVEAGWLLRADFLRGAAFADGSGREVPPGFLFLAVQDDIRLNGSEESTLEVRRQRTEVLELATARGGHNVGILESVAIILLRFDGYVDGELGHVADAIKNGASSSLGVLLVSLKVPDRH